MKTTGGDKAVTDMSPSMYFMKALGLTLDPLLNLLESCDLALIKLSTHATEARTSPTLSSRVGGAMTDADRAVLQRLIDECEEIRPYLEKLPENQLPAWVYNLWYSALLEVRGG